MTLFAILLPFYLLINLFANPTSCTINDNAKTNPRSFLLEKLAGEWLTHCIYTATELNIASYLNCGPKTISELAIQTDTQADLLYRLMNYLASNGIFYEHEGKVFSNNEVSSLLAQEHPQSLYSPALFYKEVLSPNWPDLIKTLNSGKPAFEIHNGMPVFQYFKDNSKAAALFNAAMKSKSKAVIDSLLKVYDFSNYKNFYDIGAGNGYFTYAILNQYPQLSATVFELPAVVQTAKSQMPSAFDTRCTFVSGDFFNEIPTNGDLYFLKSIIHDWSDNDVLKILENCHKAMTNNSRLLIVEPIQLPANTPDYAKAMDMLMMVITGGRERSLDEMKDLFKRGGFELLKIYPTDTEFSVLEFAKE